MIYLAKLVMIRSSKGVNLVIRHRMLPRRGNGYLITPYPRYNLALGEFGTLINGIVSGTSEPIPFSNFGLDMHIPVGTCLGHLKEALTISKRQHEGCEVFLNLAEVFEGMSDAEINEPEGVHPAGYLYLVVPPPSEDIPTTTDNRINSANISNAWGLGIRQQVQDILCKYENLFRDGLGCFNDNVVMRILFKEDADLSSLRQAPYNQSKRDKDAMDLILDPLQKEGALEAVPLSQPLPISSPAFVV
jgi:hypothetical protein